VRLEVRPDSGLTLIVPKHRSVERARSFIYEKSSWILRKLADQEEARKRTGGNACTTRDSDGLKDGDSLPYLSGELIVSINRSESTKAKVTQNKGKLIVCLPAGRDGVRPALETWYRAQAETVIRRKVDEFAARLGVKYDRCVVRSQKTLWGSCSRKRNLSFNWKLMMAPEAVVDYVIVHELAHLREMNHSKRFWAIVAEDCPGWREYRKWLRQHGRELAASLG